MSTTTEQLERRLARVEKELAELREALATKPAEPWYRQIVGSFAGDKSIGEDHRRAVRLRAASSLP